MRTLTPRSNSVINQDDLAARLNQRRDASQSRQRELVTPRQRPREVVLISKKPDELPLEDRTMSRRGVLKTTGQATVATGLALTGLDRLALSEAEAGELGKITLNQPPEDGSYYHPFKALERTDVKEGMNREDWIRLAINHGLFDRRLADHNSEQRQKFEVAFETHQPKHFSNFIISLSEGVKYKAIDLKIAKELPTLNSGTVVHSVLGSLRGFKDPKTGKRQPILDRQKISTYMDLLRSIPDLSKYDFDTRASIENAHTAHFQKISEGYQKSRPTEVAIRP